MPPSANPGIPDRRRLRPLVTTKLRPPRLPASYRERLRVDGLLDAALDEAVTLTLVSAPPGYGKTAAVAGWLEAHRIPTAWLTLDRADDDLVRFVRYLVAAIEAVRPQFGGRTLSLLATGTTPPADLVGAILLSELAGSDDSFALVLDDYHAIAARPAHDLVRFLVEHGPPFVRLVVLTREDPPLPLARLRAHGRLVELRAADLRYTDEEAAALAEAIGLPLGPEDLTRLVERTEGWAAAIQLAAVSLRGEPDPTAAIEAFHGSHRFLLDYLADEVLSRLDDDLRAFLVRISVAERFTAELARALTGRNDARTLLARTEQLNLYLVPLDPGGRWFRFHPLFADYLATQLSEGERQTLHGEAATYFEAEGLLPEAVGHALAAADTGRAAAMMARTARVAFDSGELTSLLGWLDALPDQVTRTVPELTSLAAWARFLTGDLPAAGRLAVEALQSLPSAFSGSDVEGRLLAARAVVLVLSTARGAEARELVEAGLERLGGDELFHSLALLTLGEIRLTEGDLPGAIELLDQAFVEAAGTGQPMAIFPVVYLLAVARNAHGERAQAEALCRAVLAEYVDRAGVSLPIAGFARIALGILRYEANDLAEARAELEGGFQSADALGFGRFLLGQGAAVLATVRAATGAAEGAAQAVRSGTRHARDLAMSPVVPQSSAIEAQFALARGDVAAAARWADQELADPQASARLIPRVRLQRDLVLARVLLAAGRPADAIAALGDMQAEAERGDAVAFLVSAATLEAVAREALGDEVAACAALGRAVSLAAPAGYVRRIVEDGRNLVGLLPAVHDSAPAFVDAVLTGLRQAVGPSASTASRVGAGAMPALQDARPTLAPAVEPLVEPLTARELDVLRLMAEGKGNAAIADALVVSLATAKWHVGHVLGKLGAASRTEAVLRAQRLGLV